MQHEILSLKVKFGSQPKLVIQRVTKRNGLSSPLKVNVMRCLQIGNKYLLQVSRLNGQKHNGFVRIIFYLSAPDDYLMMKR